MPCNQSFELIGSTAYSFLTVVNPARERQTGHVIEDFTIVLYNPAGDDITSSGAISVTELEIDSTPIGVYRFAVPIPSFGAEGAYTFTVTGPLGREYTTTFQSYAVQYGGSEDATAQIELGIRDPDGSAATGVVVGDLTVRVFDPDLAEVSGSVSPTLTELAAGQYILGFDIGDGDAGSWFIDIIDAARFAQGKQAVWVYRVPEADGTIPMQPEEALRRAMLDESTITDLVSERIYPAQGKFKDTYPLILYTRIGSIYFDTMEGLAHDGLAVVSLQLDIYGKGYATAKEVAARVRDYLHTFSGTITAGEYYLTVRSIRMTVERDGFDNPTDGRTDGIYRVIQEYDLWFFNQ